MMERTQDGTLLLLLGCNMKITLSSLAQDSSRSIRSKYANIPTYTYQLTLCDDFAQFPGNKKDSATALRYLPPHVTAIEFRGFFKREICHEAEKLSHDDITYREFERMMLSHLLWHYIAALPKTITHVSFAFSARQPVSKDCGYNLLSLYAALNTLPSSVTSVDLSGVIARDHNIQMALDILSKKNCMITLKTSAESMYGRLSFMREQLLHMTLTGPVDDSFILLSHLPGHLGTYQQLRSLDLGGVLNPTQSEGDRYFLQKFLKKLVHALPPKLQRLKLNANHLIKLDLDDLGEILESLPSSLNYLDLGENNLFLLPISEFKSLLSRLPISITKLRLIDIRPTLSLQDWSVHLQQLPPHITHLDWSNCQLFGLPISDFCDLVKAIPETVDTLDLSHNSLFTINAWPAIPKHITTVVLKGNKLSHLQPTQLELLFKKLPAHIEQLDLSDNGFNRLLTTAFKKYFASLPDVKLNFLPDMQLDGSKEFSQSPRSKAPSFFVPLTAKRLYKSEMVGSKQQTFADLLLVMQAVDKQHFSNHKITWHIFSYLCPRLTPRMHERFINPIFSQTRPEKVSNQSLQFIVDNAKRRVLKAVEEGTSHVDLGRCGLNRIEEVNLFKNIFADIPKKVKSLSLVGNGFSQYKKFLPFFLQALKKLPEHITHVDISHNGFELLNASALHNILDNLPMTVTQVAIGNKLLSPSIHVGARYWPASYHALTITIENSLLQARSLLDDYTKSDSWLWRLFYLHWNRNYTQEIANIVLRIDKGAITTIEDLLGELNDIECTKEEGSLRRRLSFLSTNELRAMHKASKPCAAEIEERLTREENEIIARENQTTLGLS